MSRFNRTPSREYSEFCDQIKEYAEADHEPGEDVLRVVADGLANYLKEGFRQGWKVDRTAETACIARMITGWEKCNHDGLASDDRGTPPHHPPHSDHPDLWLDEYGNPTVFAMHLYHLERDELADILDFADQHGLSIRVQANSYYHPTSTTCVTFYAPEHVEKQVQERRDDEA